MSGVKYLQQEVIDKIVLSFKEKYGDEEYERWNASLLHTYRERYGGWDRRDVAWLEVGKNPHKERNKTRPKELQLEYEDEDKDIAFQYELCIYHQVKEERRLRRNEKQRERYRKNKELKLHSY